MNEDIIEVGMIGGGLDSAVGSVHRIAMQMDGRFMLVAGTFSRDYRKGLDAARSYHVSRNRVYRDSANLLENELGKIKVIVIASPIPAHYEQVSCALESGYTVVTDKPLVSTPEQFYLLERDPAFNDENVYCIFNYTGYPAVREMKDLIRRGQIGRVKKLLIEMPQDTYQRLKNQQALHKIQKWRLEDSFISYLTLDLFVHIHSLITFLTGERVLSVSGRAHSLTGINNGLTDDIDAYLTLSNEVVASVWYSKGALGYRNGLRIRVFGDCGAIEWQQMNPEVVQYTNSDGDSKTLDRLSGLCRVMSEPRYQRFKAGHPAGFIEAFANYYADIADSIRGSGCRDVLLGLSETKAGLQVAEAIHRSALSQGTEIQI
jgi:predicted dehydrogenase